MAFSKLPVVGYSVAKSDKESLPGKYFCSLCGNVLREPLQTNCGHFYCRLCYTSCQEADGSFVCRLDEETLKSNEVYPDNFMKREILSLTLKCPGECSWSGQIRDMESHLTKCPMSTVQCPNTRCTVQIKRSELPHHLEEECSFRRQPCSYCKKMIVGYDMDEHHSQFCESIPVRCHACNKEGIKRGELQRHCDPIDGDCEATQMDCAFEAVGCKAEKSMKRTDAKRHEEVCGVFHLSMLLAFALDLEKKVQNALSGSLPGEFSGVANFNPDYQLKLTEAISKIDGVLNDIKDVRQKLREHSTRITTLESQLGRHGNNGAGATASVMFSSLTFHDKNVILPDELSRWLVNLENRVANHEVLICNGGQNMNGNQQQAHGLQRQLEAAQDTIKRLERKVESHEHVLAIRNVALADLEEFVRQQQVSSYDGALLWKIPDYARKKNDAVSGRQTSFYSACFYTSRHGYKMCARLYLNGDGMGKGTHISVFFTVMRGQYDALLRWPFRQKVTIMLLDQDNVEHVIDAFRPDPNSSSFQRPRREMNVASGCPLFCALSELNKHAYVRDDVMFMKIIVDTSDL